MSSRICRAMGYGLTWEAYTTLSTLPQPDNNVDSYWERLNDAFENATDEDLTVPKGERGFGNEDRGGAVIEPRLLAKNYTEGGRRPVDLGSATGLYEVMYAGDNPSHVIFFPSLSFRKTWYHHDDDLDYAFEANRHVFDESEDDGDRFTQRDPRGFAGFTKFGPYPFTNDLMNPATGAHVDWDHVTLLDRRTDWAPAVPRSIRWYLNKLAVLDDNGINQLRPLIAQWWS